MSNDYHDDVKKKNTLKLREYLKELPSFLSVFFRGIAETTASRTRIGYAYDLKIFFTFLSEEVPKFGGKPVNEFTLEDLALITVDDIEEYVDYLSYYIKRVNNKTIEYQNEECGKSRKISSIRTMFSYFYKKRVLKSNPSELIDMPKIHDKQIIRLEVNEIANLLDEVETGDHMTERQKKIHEYTKKRDLAIITLLLGTGMRVSECVGINMTHLDFDVGGVKITRKGGDQVVLYFGDEVEEALLDYLDERQQITPIDGHEDALFLSLQRRRITDRAIQVLVKKYASFAVGLKKISPHKLRSTYGTRLYRESGDIYLVADVLGHADVNTTKKHYAAIDEDKRRSAAKYIRLRKD